MKTIRRQAVALCTAAAAAVAGMSVAHAATTTPIEHVVVIYSENISFDHYFATYPNALNASGETLQSDGSAAPTFTAKADTPAANTLANKNLLSPNNPNSIQPFRLTPSQAVTADQNHEYDAEQKAANGGAMDKFPETVSTDIDKDGNGYYVAPGLTMGYFDGNTVTGLWNYAQNYAMSDNSFSTIFGPSTPGALNLISGTTTGATLHDAATGEQQTIETSSTFAGVTADGKTASVVGDPDPLYDDCSNSSSSGTNSVAALHSTNIGDQLNAKGVTWGWFQGGFRPTEPATDTSRARCGSSHKTLTGQNQTDYNPHHEPFQYYASTANPHHLPPSSVDMIGKTDQANHQYDLKDFEDALDSGNLPAVSYLKASNFQDGHAGYSNPLDEQAFMTHYINAIQNSPEWDSTAIVIAYDDSDGWYDHVAPKVLNGSNDAVNDSEICTSVAKTIDADGQCGPGTRQPLIVISPYAKSNFVDHTYTEQTSITKFIQDNWGLGRLGDNSFDQRAGKLDNMFDFASATRSPKVFLNETNGTVAADFASVQKADTVSRESINLKPVAEGMNDPQVTENGVANVAKLHPATDKQDNDSSTKDDNAASGSSTDGIIAAVLAILAGIGGLAAWFYNGHPGLNLAGFNLPDVKLPF